MIQLFFQTIVKKLIRYSFLVKIRKLLVHFRILDYFYQINLIGMLTILLTREKLTSVINLFTDVYLYGIDYVKSRHLTIDYYQKLIKSKENYDLITINRNIDYFAFKPIISMILISSNDNSNWLNQAIESIRQQFYPYWELCLYDNASGHGGAHDCLKKVRAAGDHRIKIIPGCAEQSTQLVHNCLLKQAGGEFIALMGEADILSPDALYEVARLLNYYPEAEFIYSDEDKIGEDGTRFDPYFKVDWSPDLFLSMMYTGNLAVYRLTTVERLGGFRTSFGAASAYDLILRLIEKTDPAQIFHLSRILYHARSSEGALNRLPQIPAMHEVGKIALNDYRQRNAIPGAITDGMFPGCFRFQRFWPDNPKVSIIIPFRDNVQLLERCVTSIITKTDYQNYEVLMINNQSKDKDTFAYLDQISDNPVIRIISYDHPFNFSAINNFAAGETQADYILFLNNDTEVIAPGWLGAMMEHMTRKEVGVVGAKLIYYDHTIQHAGVIMGITNICGHAFRRFPADHPGYFGQLQTVRNCSAVTGACMLVKKAIFQSVGGFDQQNLPISYNDVDLCLKILEKGYLVVWTPYALLYHREYASRGDDRDLQGSSREKYQRVIAELGFIEKKWGCYIENDPYYNHNLTRLFENYGF
jgi:GT2 family glycosyltransferase